MALIRRRSRRGIDHCRPDLEAPSPVRHGLGCEWHLKAAQRSVHLAGAYSKLLTSTSDELVPERLVAEGHAMKIATWNVNGIRARDGSQIASDAQDREGE